MPYADLKDVRIHYDLAGPATAPVLVFSNSLGTNVTMWDSQMLTFSKNFRVLRSDTRGHGQSSAPPGPYNVEQLARDVLHLLDLLQLDRVYFCGLSMGGMIGMWLALNFPNRLHKVVLSSTAAKIGTAEFWDQRIETVRKMGMKGFAPLVMERWFTRSFRTNSHEAVARTQRMLETTNLDGYLANCMAIRDFDARTTISAINLSALVISGTHDPATTVADGRFLADQIKGAQFVELDASHLCNIEQAGAFNSAVASYLLSPK